VTSDFEHPTIRTGVERLEAHFAHPTARELRPLRNPHHEPKVSEEQRRAATPAAVLIPIVEHEAELTVLVTRRHPEISYAGHICFPGGRSDANDASPEVTALREAHEEIDLDPSVVRLIGRLGDYVTQTGFRVAPIIGVVSPPLNLQATPSEVQEILEIPLAYLLRSESYLLAKHDPDSANAVFYLDYQGVVVTGPTVSIMMGLYEALLETHLPE
jgi:8-oxo-dGTP pyrophosphatase MutT (NUDIX family)